MTAALRWLVLATHVPASGSGGGMVRYCVELVRALRDQPGVDVAVLGTPEARPFFEDLVGADAVHDLPGLPVAVRSVVERAGPTALPVLREGWDVVHGAKHLVPRSTPGATRLLTVHDMNPLDRPADFGTVKRLGLRRPYLASIAQAEALVCVSEATRARLTAWAPAAGRRAGVVHLAAAPGLLQATSTPVDALAGRRFAVVVGDSSPRKNLALAYRFWPEVARAVPDAVLAVVGPPSWGPSQQAAAGLVRDGHVVELGHRTDGELRWLYEHAAVVLCPSQLEGFGLPVVEGAAFGATVLLGDDPAMGEVGPPDAVRLSLHLPSAWAREVVRLLQLPQRTAATVGAMRQWSDVAAGTVEEVRRVRER